VKRKNGEETIVTGVKVSMDDRVKWVRKLLKFTAANKDAKIKKMRN
jgi:hypothetical protein